MDPLVSTAWQSLLGGLVIVAVGLVAGEAGDVHPGEWSGRSIFGLIYLTLMMALIRSRAVAYADRLVVVNGYRRHEYEWPQIVAARLPPGAPWVTLDLADGETASPNGDPAPETD